MTLTILLPSSLERGSLIGKQGTYLKRLETNYSVRINFPKDRKNSDDADDKSGNPNEITIRGGKTGAAAAKKELVDLIEYEKENGNVVVFTVSVKSLPRILGKAGAQVIQIKEETNVSVDVDQADDDAVTATITLRGTKAGTASAKSMILAIAKEVDDEARLTIEIPRTFHTTLIGSGGSSSEFSSSPFEIQTDELLPSQSAISSPELEDPPTRAHQATLYASPAKETRPTLSRSPLPKPSPRRSAPPSRRKSPPSSPASSGVSSSPRLPTRPSLARVRRHCRSSRRSMVSRSSFPAGTTTPPLETSSTARTSRTLLRLISSRSSVRRRLPSSLLPILPFVPFFPLPSRTPHCTDGCCIHRRDEQLSHPPLRQPCRCSESTTRRSHKEADSSVPSPTAPE